MNVNDIKNNLISEMKTFFGDDRKRIDHAMSVLGFAEQINEFEPGDFLTITASAILHDIGIHAAEEKYNSSAGNYQEIEGPPIAKDILKKCRIDKKRVEHICKIIANHHSAKDIDTDEFKIIWDADWLVNLQDFKKNQNSNFIEKTFKTHTGKKIADKIYGNPLF